jgi:predicted esterase/sRNA-binding regulator protein Hfq
MILGAFNKFITYHIKVSSVLISCLLVTFLINPAFADSIFLKSGKVIDGNISEETDEYIKLETADGQSLYFYKNAIEEIRSESQKESHGSNQRSSFPTGLLDYSNEGYMLFMPKGVSDLAPVLICLPGMWIKTKQDINNWAFHAGKKGFVVLGLDVDYEEFGSLSQLDIFYNKITNILSSLSGKYPIDQKRIFLAGTSAGGMLSLALALRYPDNFSGISVVSGGRLGYGAQDLLRRADGLEIFMIHGDRDERISISEFNSTKSKLQNKGAILEYKVVKDGRHTLTSSSYREAVDWLSDLSNQL